MGVVGTAGLSPAAAAAGAAAGVDPTIAVALQATVWELERALAAGMALPMVLGALLSTPLSVTVVPYATRSALLQAVHAMPPSAFHTRILLAFRTAAAYADPARLVADLSALHMELMTAMAVAGGMQQMVPMPTSMPSATLPPFSYAPPPPLPPPPPPPLPPILPPTHALPPAPLRPALPPLPLQHLPATSAAPPAAAHAAVADDGSDDGGHPDDGSDDGAANVALADDDSDGGGDDGGGSGGNG